MFSKEPAWGCPSLPRSLYPAAQGTRLCRHTALRQLALSARGALCGKSLRVHQEPAVWITGCAVPFASPNIQQKPTSPAEKSAVQRLLQSQERKTTVVTEGNSRPPRRAAHLSHVIILHADDIAVGTGPGSCKPKSEFQLCYLTLDLTCAF